MLRSALFVLAAAALAAAPATADAGWPFHYGSGGWQGLWGNPYVYSQGGAYIPPYYAIHPPVYYSGHITARPYGASPYALPYGPVALAPPLGNVMALAQAEPLLIENPYVKVAAAPTAALNGAQAKAEVQPLRIDNPFVAAR